MPSQDDCNLECFSDWRFNDDRAMNIGRGGRSSLQALFWLSVPAFCWTPSGFLIVQRFVFQFR